MLRHPAYYVLLLFIYKFQRVLFIVIPIRVNPNGFFQDKLQKRYENEHVIATKINTFLNILKKSIQKYS